jgi:hypothetical protein
VREEKQMGNDCFEKLCKELVVNYYNQRVEKTDQKKLAEDDVFVVWMCKTLQNSKALASTTLFDGMYYELTYNGDEKEMYLDAYKKWENKCISLNCRDCAHAHKIDDITYECDAEEYDIDTPSCFMLKE